MAKKPAEAVQEITEKISNEIIYGDKVYAKAVHLAVGVDLLGSKTSLVSGRGANLEVTSNGIIASSGKNNRRIFIPFSNVKAAELE